ncbi:MAG TPA: DUF998 domain-containing protein [Balneolales bacterium]|nr:DUF998 domain-containing protein [Balneolales bacterium]
MDFAILKNLKKWSAQKVIPKTLIFCGLLSSLLYVAMNVMIPMQWDGYSVFSQTVSELSAIGAPTRPLWVKLGIIYTLLMTAFGFGVWLSASKNRKLRIVGGLAIAFGLIGLFWPPMHLRGTIYTITDTLHIVFAMVELLLMILMISFGATALGRRFKIYSFLTLLIFVIFGILTGMEAPNIAVNQPTPWIGLWERINMAAFLLWVALLSVLLLKMGKSK